MAATTLAAILALMRATLEGDTVGLTASGQPFTHDRQPNSVLQDTYYLDDGGQISRQSVTNDQEVRIDRLVVYVAKPLAFAGQDQVDAMHTLLDTIYTQLVQTARDHGWNIESDQRRVTRNPKTQLIVGSLGVNVDYDFDATPA